MQKTVKKDLLGGKKGLRFYNYMEFYYNFANVKCIVSSWGTCKIVHSSASFPFFFKQLQVDSKSEDLGE